VDRTPARTGWILALSALLVIGALAAAITANSWKHSFRVAHVRAEGNRILADSEVTTLARIPERVPLFDVDLTRARLRVMQSPYIRSAALARDIPDGLTITVEERTPLAALALGRELYIDAGGFVLPAPRSGSLPDLPVITGALRAADCVPGRRTTSARVTGALEILRTASAVGDGLYRLISEVHCREDSTYLLFTTDSGVPVVFGRGNVALKLLELDGFWKQIAIERGPSHLRTVDLRFAEQVVVRWDDAAR